ncbi:MAG: hypothetical protein NC192_11675, partial [Muribaculaceae bacterium]|nr:hypothetical protein [Muribaculaceae bacterium]
LQIMDIDENGIPEAALARDDTVFVNSKIHTVTANGQAVCLSTANFDICYDDGTFLRGGSLTPYERDGETVWLSRYNTGGTDEGVSGDYILKYDGNTVDGEIIRHSEYERNPGDGYMMWEYYFYYNVLGEDVTEEEYDLKYDEYINTLQPSAAVYAMSGYKENTSEFWEIISNAMNEYLDKRDENIH